MPRARVGNGDFMIWFQWPSRSLRLRRKSEFGLAWVIRSRTYLLSSCPIAQVRLLQMCRSTDLWAFLIRVTGVMFSVCGVGKLLRRR